MIDSIQGLPAGSHHCSSSASRSPSRSNRFSQSERRAPIHCSATESPFVSIRQVRTLPIFRRMHQPALFEHLYVLNHRRQGDIERLRETRNRNRALTHPFKNRPPRGIAQRMENPIDARCLGWRAPGVRGPRPPIMPAPLQDFSRSSRHPSLRISGASAPSKNAACSVKTRVRARRPPITAQTWQVMPRIASRPSPSCRRAQSVIRHDVLICRLIRTHHPLVRTALDAKSRALPATHSKVHLEFSVSEPSSSRNQRRFFTGSANAANTRCGVAG